MIKGITGELIFFAVTLLTPMVIISSCVPPKHERDIRGEVANELWEMVVSKEQPDAATGVAGAEDTVVAFRDKSLGKPLTKAPEMTGG
jgi:hypothetical protein